jgi:hypothetical protein
VKLLKIEQEVTINFNLEEDVAVVDCRNPVWVRKMDKLLEQCPNEVRVIAETEDGRTYEVPKDFINVKPRIKRNMSEEQRRILAERMRSIATRNK